MDKTKKLDIIKNMIGHSGIKRYKHRLRVSLSTSYLELSDTLYWYSIEGQLCVSFKPRGLVLTTSKPNMMGKTLFNLTIPKDIVSVLSFNYGKPVDEGDIFIIYKDTATTHLKVIVVDKEFIVKRSKSMVILYSGSIAAEIIKTILPYTESLTYDKSTQSIKVKWLLSKDEIESLLYPFKDKLWAIDTFDTKSPRWLRQIIPFFNEGQIVMDVLEYESAKEVLERKE